MSSTTASPSSSTIDAAELQSFHDHLQSSRRIVALLGAGLSASSGLPTFRGAGGLWRTHNATSLATPEAFAGAPGFVWQFYSYRRHMALNAKPNRAHMALAKLSSMADKDFLTISQNVDGLSPRAGHRLGGLKLIHGSLFDVKCSRIRCGYVDRNNFVDPIVPILAIPQSGQDPTANSGASGEDTSSSTNPLIRGIDIADEKHEIAEIEESDLPHCPQCKTGLLRPGVVWFGESLPAQTLHEISAFMSQPEKIDLMLVIGTSSTVYPAAGYTQVAERRGARVAVINPDPECSKDLREGLDWHFCGDAAEIVPELLKPLIGQTETFVEGKNYGVVDPQAT